MFHYVTFGLIFFPTLYFLYAVVTDFSVHALMTVALGVGVIMATLFARLFPLGVQDRVIRLEERLRLASVLPPEMHGDIESIPTDLLVGLRFAPDEELEKCVEKVFDLQPLQIIQQLDLRRPIFQRTAAYGHFGRSPDENGGFTWERTDRVDDLKACL